MLRALTLHPDSRCTAATRIEVNVARSSPAGLVLRYVVTGAIADLRLPPAAAPERTDELWRHTCFEAFVRAADRAAYYELNFAPSTQWAAYRFTGYRSGMSVAGEISRAPRIDVRASPARYELEAAIGLDGLPGLPGDAVWRLNLAAVIEETSGRRSYWALAHPPGDADFHHSDCFVQVLGSA